MIQNCRRVVALILLALFVIVPGNAPAQNAKLTPDFMSKMLSLIAARGEDREYPAWAANALGLTAAGRSWANHSLAVRESNSTLMHSFAVSRADDLDILLAATSPERPVLAFRSTRDGKLVSAFTWDKQNPPLMRSPAEAQADFNAECDYWIANAGKIPLEK